MPVYHARPSCHEPAGDDVMHCIFCMRRVHDYMYFFCWWDSLRLQKKEL